MIEVGQIDVNPRQWIDHAVGEVLSVGTGFMLAEGRTTIASSAFLSLIEPGLDLAVAQKAVACGPSV